MDSHCGSMARKWLAAGSGLCQIAMSVVAANYPDAVSSSVRAWAYSSPH